MTYNVLSGMLSLYTSPHCVWRTLVVASVVDGNFVMPT